MIDYIFKNNWHGFKLFTELHSIAHELRAFSSSFFCSQTYHKFSFSVSLLTLAHLKMMHKYVVRLTLHVQQNLQIPAVNTDVMKDGICVKLKWICGFSTTIPHRQVGSCFINILFVKFAAACCLLSKIITNNNNNNCVHFIGEDVMVVLTMKAGNLSEWIISVFAFLNNTDLYTEPQNDQGLFYCYLPPDNSTCPDLNMSTEEHTQENPSPPRQNTSNLKNTSSITPSLKTTTITFQVTASTLELKCQTTRSSFLFYYQEHNETARSAALPVTRTKKGEKLSENSVVSHNVNTTHKR